MPNKKISELSAAGALAGNELVEVVKGGANVQTTTQDIANLAPGGGGGGSWGSITGTLSSQTDLQNALNDKADAGVTIVTDTGAYTLQASDLTLINAGATLIIDGDGTGDLTVPLNATVAFPVGTMIGVRDYDNVVATGGVTITGSSGSLAIPSGMTATLEKTGTNTWLLHNGAASSGGGTWGSITGTLSDQSDLNTALGAKAPLASPTFTGTPAAPTAAAATNTTQIATTAFVQSNSIGYTPADELTEIAGLTLESDITVDQLLEALAIPVIIPIHADSAATMAITNMPSGITVLPNNQTTHYLKVNTNKIRAFRLCARVSTTSASVNNPRMYIQYSINGGSSYVTLGAGTIASGDAISLFTGAGAVQQTNWITIPVEAKGDSFQWRVVTEGGDGAADPAVGNVFIEGKT